MGQLTIRKHTEKTCHCQGSNVQNFHVNYKTILKLISSFYIQQPKKVNFLHPVFSHLHWQPQTIKEDVIKNTDVLKIGAVDEEDGRWTPPALSCPRLCQEIASCLQVTPTDTSPILSSASYKTFTRIYK